MAFPNPVNEKAARTVAGGVLLLSIATLVLSLTAGEGWLWLLAPIVYGFAARVADGPTFSPLGQLATRVVAPRLGEPVLVAGPPKRFAQAIGLVVTGGALVFTAFGVALGAQIFLGMIVVAAGLESLAGYCLGCKAFALLMKAGLVPEETCEACANIHLRGAAPLAS